MFSFLLPSKEEARWWVLTFPKQTLCEHVCVSNLRNKTETYSLTYPLCNVTDCDESSQGRWMLFTVVHSVQTHGSNRWQHCSFGTKTGYLVLRQ